MTADRDFDYIVIGAGTGRCVLAARLSADPEGRRVLLVEAGVRRRQRTDLHHPHLARALQDRCRLRRSRPFRRPGPGTCTTFPGAATVGGSGSINAMAFLRGDRRKLRRVGLPGLRPAWDYDVRAAVLQAVRDRCPTVTRADRGTKRTPRLARPACLHPLSQAYLAAAQQAGHPLTADLHGARLRASAATILLIVDGRRQSTATAYLALASSREPRTRAGGVRRKRLTVEGDRCTGVDVIVDDERRHYAATAEIVPVRGSHRQPAPAAALRTGSAAQLEQVGLKVRHDLPGVGRNLQDHIILAGLTVEASGPLPAPAGNLGQVTLMADSEPGRASIDLQIVFIHVPFANPWQTVPEHGYTFGVGHMKAGELGDADAGQLRRPVGTAHRFPLPRRG